MKKTLLIVAGIAMLLTSYSCKNYYESLMQSPDPQYRMKGAFDY